MRKILILIVFGFLLNLKAQNYESQLPSLNITAPTASGIASKIKSPSAISTGIPDIGIPFFTLPTHNKNVSINIGLSYHPNNTFMGSKASDVGLGWNVAGASNVIYREINPIDHSPTNNYHFSFMGKSGTFYFEKDIFGNLNVYNITENKYTITATETGTDLYRFTIKDENSITYFFEDLDVSYYKNIVFSNSAEKKFTSCYYLTRVNDVNNNEIVSLQYTNDSYNFTANNNVVIPVKTLKIQKITAHNFGSIHFDYALNINDRKSYQDPFALNSITLRNTAGKQVEKYIIETVSGAISYPLGHLPGDVIPCSQAESQQKRLLKKILKYGSGSVYETTEIKYPSLKQNFDFTDYWSEFSDINPFITCFPYEHYNPKYLGIALLQSIKYPNGTEVKYTFEPNQYYVDKSFPDIKVTAPPHEVVDRDAQYFELIGDFAFNYRNGGGSVTFNLPYNTDEPDGYSYLYYYLAANEVSPNDPIQPTNNYQTYTPELNGGVLDPNGHKKYPPGINSLTLNAIQKSGTLYVRRIRYKSNPLPNFSTGKGVRIKRIEYLDNNTVNPALTRTYNYQLFNQSNQTSGYLNDNGFEQSVTYSNVKETVGENSGYTKYYYKTLKDAPTFISPDSTQANVVRYENILKPGLLEKREVYNANHHVIQKDSIVSDIATLRGYYRYEHLIRNGIVRNQKTISTSYTSTGSYSNISEVTRSVNDYNVTQEKNTGADGVVNEVNLTYPFQHVASNPKLWNAHIKDIPLTVETKRNGTVISKGETKFENASHFYPTSQISFLPDNLSQSMKNVSYDIYDDKGNLVQFTAFPEVGSVGVPTTIIYGYNKTMPIAKIEGAKLSDIPSSLITAIVNASNEDANAPAAQEEAKEQALIAALNTFKNDPALENFMVTCYTYNPLVGITTTIPPNGMMELYKYDSFNRLLKVVDVNGNTVKEHQYNYKQ